ncbi:MAG: diaminopimelate epimerase [Acidimicrobiales bacterium]
MTIQRLSKHHGLGNDFLVAVHRSSGPLLGAEVARFVCDRHRGVGADGLIQVWPDPSDSVDLVMDLRNSDGSQAEMSGNGIRCLSQAALNSGLVAAPTFRVGTQAGPREVTVTATDCPDVVHVGVGMGQVSIGPEYDLARFDQSWRARQADIGNPHLVVLVDHVARLDARALGTAIEAGFPGGMNVEFISRSGEDRLDLVVWERGAGLTQACGTGSAAAAAVARSWGMAGDHVEVDNPGGRLQVVFDGDEVVLTGPAQKICDVEVELDLVPA